MRGVCPGAVCANGVRWILRKASCPKRERERERERERQRERKREREGGREGGRVVSYPDPNVRNNDYRLQYNITYRESGNEVVGNGSMLRNFVEPIKLQRFVTYTFQHYAIC